MFNVVLCNSYLLSSIKTQDEFWTLLYKRLFQDSGPELALFQQTLSPDTGDDPAEQAIEHRQVHRGKKGECRGCSLLGQTRTANKRRVLCEISLNVRNNFWARSSVYGCLACDVPLCKDGECFEQYHEHYVHYQ